MNKASQNAYLQTRVMTASPEQLQLMLYDGAIRFCDQASEAIRNGDIEGSYNAITKAQKIVIELAGSMKDDIAPETCANMRRLYMFCYDRLVMANLKKDLAAVDEALQILKEIRQTWLMLMEKLNEEKEGTVVPTEPASVGAAEDLETGGSTFSLEG